MAITSTAPHKVYRHPPIEEVVCEFEFSQKKAWDVTMPGRVYEKLRGAYPDHKKGLERLGTAATSDGKRRVQFSENELSVHIVSPYPGWDVFFDHVRHALRTYLQTAEPATATQINLRYRNRIMLPTQSPALGDYFTLGIAIPHGLPTRLISYVTGIRAVYEDNPKKVLSVSLTAIPPEGPVKHGVEVVLDVMASQIQMQEAAELDQLFAIVGDLRDRAAEAFEKIVTDQTRRLFA